MRKERATAWKRLEHATERMELFDSLMTVFEISVPVAVKKWQLELEEKAAYCQEQLEKYMHWRYSKMIGWTAKKGKYEWKFYYTTEKDGDGWYWWKIQKVERLAPMLDIPVSRYVGEELNGKCRKRKDAKEKMLKRYEERLEKIAK